MTLSCIIYHDSFLHLQRLLRWPVPSCSRHQMSHGYEKVLPKSHVQPQLASSQSNALTYAHAYFGSG